MGEHRLDDAVGAPSVLDDLSKIGGDCGDKLVDLRAPVGIERGDRLSLGLPQLVEQLDRKPGEVVDEVERVLDLVRDAGGELAQRRHLLRLDQVRLGSTQLDQRPLRRVARLAQFGQQSRVLNGDHRLGGEVLHETDLGIAKRSWLLTVQYEGGNDLVVLDHGHPEGTAHPGAQSHSPAMVVSGMRSVLHQNIGHMNDAPGRKHPRRRRVWRKANRSFGLALQR